MPTLKPLYVWLSPAKSVPERSISDVITHKDHMQKTCRVLDILAEGEGFEPPEPEGSTVFKTVDVRKILYHLVPRSILAIPFAGGKSRHRRTAMYSTRVFFLVMIERFMCAKPVHRSRRLT